MLKELLNWSCISSLVLNIDRETTIKTDIVNTLCTINEKNVKYKVVDTQLQEDIMLENLKIKTNTIMHISIMDIKIKHIRKNNGNVNWSAAIDTLFEIFIDENKVCFGFFHSPNNLEKDNEEVKM